MNFSPRPAPFENRNDAGERLAQAVLREVRTAEVVFAIPRGGVVVACPLARRLGCPLQPVFVGKLRHPFQPEYAIGAVDERGKVHIADPEAELFDERVLDGIIERARFLLERQHRMYLPALTRMTATDRDVILVDDGLATGESCRAALAYLRDQRPRSLTLAVPCASTSGVAKARPFFDRLVSVFAPDPGFRAVGDYYQDFRATESDEVLRILTEINHVREAS